MRDKQEVKRSFTRTVPTGSEEELPRTVQDKQGVKRSFPVLYKTNRE
jgi:hypothetical protein